jgi:hypothetical protein
MAELIEHLPSKMQGPDFKHQYRQIYIYIKQSYHNLISKVITRKQKVRTNSSAQSNLKLC